MIGQEGGVGPAPFWVWALIVIVAAIIGAVGAIFAAWVSRSQRREMRSDHGTVLHYLIEAVERLGHLSGRIDEIDDEERQAHAEIREALSVLQAGLSAHLQHHTDNEHTWRGEERRRPGDRRKRDIGRTPDRRVAERRQAREDEL